MASPHRRNVFALPVRSLEMPAIGSPKEVVALYFVALQREAVNKARGKARRKMAGRSLAFWLKKLQECREPATIHSIGIARQRRYRFRR